MEITETTERLHVLDKSRQAVLNAGYRLVVYKSRLRKSAVTLKKRITLFYF
ncbi:hypothetical protein ACFQZJ_08810 [Maribacter chungangensis]|uniref:Uncharacterized protein n=1 Tax=Maribacter chungangensis TaxID=1069117 RepID=A0ABW3B2W0_9FLAO